MSGQNGIKKRLSYNASFKLKVVKYAEERNNCAAARNFNISESQVRQWRKKKSSLQRMPRTKKAARGRSSFFPELEKYLSNWVMERRKKGFKVDRTVIRREALRLLKDDRFKSKKPTMFRASTGWCSRFLNRFGLCLRTSTKSNLNNKTRYKREIRKPSKYNEDYYMPFNDENDESVSINMNDNIKDSLEYHENSKEQQITNIYQDDLASIEAFYYARKNAIKKLLKAQCIGIFKYKCLICKKIIENNIKVMQHINAHIDDQRQCKPVLSDLTRCKYCFRYFKTPFSMQCHIETVHLQSDSLVCRICNQEFVQFKTFSLHMKNVHAQFEMPYSCQLCRYRSSFHQDIVQHFDITHNATNKVLCHYCLKIFHIKFSDDIGDMQNYFYHLHKHQLKSLTKKCSSCCLIFLTVQELRKHQSRAHKLMTEHKGVRAIKSTIAKSLKEKLTEQLNITYPDSIVTNVEYKRSYKKPVKQLNKKADDIRPENLITSSLKCCECNHPITFNHFGRFLRCGSCCYSTNCSKAFVDHMILQHSRLQKKRKNNGIDPKPTTLKQPMSCLCGFTSLDGNSVASHLIFCRKPSCQITPAKSISRVIRQAENGHWRIYKNNKRRNSHYSVTKAKKNKKSLNLSRRKTNVKIKNNRKEKIQDQSKQNDISSEINDDNIITSLPLKIMVNEDKEINLSNNVGNVTQNKVHQTEEKETEENVNMLNALGLISRSKSTVI